MSFDIAVNDNVIVVSSFNPFGTGQCLSTKQCELYRNKFDVSIPLEQGNVFRLTTLFALLLQVRFNPFGTGQCLSTV